MADENPSADLAFELNPQPVLCVDAAGVVRKGNAAARLTFGGHKLTGSSWLHLCPDMKPARWEQILTSDIPVQHSVVIGQANLVLTHVRSPDAESVYVFGESETAASASGLSAEYARFPEMNPGPVARLLLDGTIVLANRASRKVFGENVVGQNWRQVCLDITDEKWASILEAWEPFVVEARVEERDYTFAHLRDPGGHEVFVYGADVTRQRQAERALRQSEKMATLGTLAAGVSHELNNPAAATRRAAEQMREAFARLEAAHLLLDEVGLTDSQRELLRSIATTAEEAAGRPSSLDALDRSDRETDVEDWLDDHGVADASRIASQLVGQGLDPSKLDELADAFTDDGVSAAITWAASVFPVYVLAHEIGQGASRISEIVTALKSYSYLGQAPIKAIDIHEGLDNTLIILRNKLKVGINVTRDYCEDMPLVPAYGSELNQVWTNLIDNAADALGGKGDITIRTRKQDRWAVVEIEDNGPGIPADVVRRVFDPFFTTKEPGKGTGLGLSTSYSIVTERHKGKIEVTSKPGRTVFTVRIPLD